MILHLGVLVILCGVTAFTHKLLAEERIVHGKNATEVDAPYIVSLQRNHSHICGASILNDHWILTAAHCIKHMDPTQFSIQYGVTHISNNSINRIGVERLIRHPKFVHCGNNKNDIAVIKLSEPMNFSCKAQPVDLPPAHNSTPAEADAVLSGWGKPQIGKKSVNDLQIVTIKVFSDKECKKSYPRTDKKYNICAGIPKGGKGQCQGDSGGPLVVKGVQVGVVSWSIKPCASKGHPGVLTKVSSYVKWIEKQIDKYS